MKTTATASAAALLLALAILVIPVLASSSPAGANDASVADRTAAPASRAASASATTVPAARVPDGPGPAEARPRAIVTHGTDYATPDFVARVGRLGRSWGCPALDPAVSRELIDTIQGGSVVFGYYPDRDYLSKSAFVGDAGAQALTFAASAQ